MTKLSIYALPVLLITVSNHVLADSEGFIKYRQHQMNILSYNLKSSAMILKNKIKADVSAHSRAIENVAKIMPDLFPDDSDFGDTSAKAEVWEQADRFKNELTKFMDAANAFNKNPSMKSFASVGKSCKSCHKAFKEK